MKQTLRAGHLGMLWQAAGAQMAAPPTWQSCGGITSMSHLTTITLHASNRIIWVKHSEQSVQLNVCVSAAAFSHNNSPS
jgi:hypothetical protein